MGWIGDIGRKIKNTAVAAKNEVADTLGKRTLIHAAIPGGVVTAPVDYAITKAHRAYQKRQGDRLIRARMDKFADESLTANEMPGGVRYMQGLLNKLDVPTQPTANPRAPIDVSKDPSPRTEQASKDFGVTPVRASMAV
jgi:hypothetical protein